MSVQILKLAIEKVQPDKPQSEDWEHGVIWSGISEIKIKLGVEHWYGGGGLVHQQYPLEKLAQYPAPFITSDNGHTGLQGILEPFWWNSAGEGFWVESDEFNFSFNTPLGGTPPTHSFQDPAHNEDRPALAGDVETDGVIHLRGDNLRIRFFNCDNAREVVQAFWNLLEFPSPPPDDFFVKPLWTTWAHFKNGITQEKIEAYLNQLEKHGFTASLFGIDAKWQTEFGDTHFDVQKFPQPHDLIERIHRLHAEATVWAIPFYMETSEHFTTAIQKDLTLKNRDGEVYIGTWWEGDAAFLDLTNFEALDWHLDNLTQLSTETGLDGFKFDAGEAMFFVNEELAPIGVAPNQATHRYVEKLSQRYPWSDVRCGWRNQAEPMLFRQWDKSTRWDFANGLASCISQAITLNMLGYPFSFPDMIGGNQYGEMADEELLIRWTQAVAPMPIIQFSIPPWQFSDACITICRKYADLHAELANQHIVQAKKQQPLVRPLWWLDPIDERALSCADEYLIGDTLLVAPVIEAGAQQRDIYLPQGVWRSYWEKDEIYNGSQLLSDYPAPLDTLPLFVKVN